MEVSVMSKPVLLVAALALALTPLASAQRPGGGGGGMGGGGFGGGMGGAARVDKSESIARELKLSTEKKAEVVALLDEVQKQAEPINKRADAARKIIAGSTVDGKPYDPAMKDLTLAEAQMAALEADALIKVIAKADEKQRNKAPKVFELMSGMFRLANWRMSR
jgi:hypothetical protein